MRNLFCSMLLGLLWLNVLGPKPAAAQERRGTIAGHVTDANHDPLVGARVELQPVGHTAVTDAQGQFSLSELQPGKYTLTISYVGFKPYSKEVTIGSGSGVTEDAALEIESVNEQVIVRGERERGEIEALNRERTADEIVQVLPAEVITSLPNTNIADALGRMPSVSLERDEGEGKYVQIRGTEPRLSNVTLDGVHVPSPESVRNVKLDAIPADLVDSVEISKTLSANQEGDAIGGSVNLVTKRAGDRPFLSLSAMGGFTPISGGGILDQFGATYGRRFGKEKRLGVLIGGSYDYNQRGTDDIEPSWTTADFGTTGSPDIRAVFAGTDVREYKFYRHRYGFAGSADYKLGAASSAYIRGLFSQFKDNGEDWIYSPGINSYASPSLSGPDSQVTYADVIRRPGQRIFNVIAGANHVLGSTLINYELALGQARYTGGFFSANFNDGPSDVTFALDTSDPFTPQFKQLSGTNIFDPANYRLKGGFFKPLALNTDDHIFERDLTGAISVTRQYAVHSHFGAFEIGAKIRDAHKTQFFKEHDFDFNGTLALSSVLQNFSNPNYYFGKYKLVGLSDFNKIEAFYNANRNLFTENTDFEHRRTDSNNYVTNERVFAGYVMNTITFGHFRLQGGLRIEGTQGSFLGFMPNFDRVTGAFLSDTPRRGEDTYTDFLPSVQVQYAFNGDTKIRAVYGRGIARPNFSDLPPFALTDLFRHPPQVTVGNPNLKPTHANDFDLLFEHYLKTVGLIEAGWFYKALADPIFLIQTTLPLTDPNFPGFRQRQPVNGPSAHIQGVEFAWQQHLRFLPGLLSGAGVAANYSYTTSKASFPIDPNTGTPTRSDSPALLRQAPNNWNFDATYDKGPISARLGLTHNDRSIFAYNFIEGQDLGLKGPNGDVYYYPHTQVDAQVNYRLPHAHGIHAVVSLLNLTNEVFGFYQGSEQFPIQREYYSRTISAGLRWTSDSDVK